MVIVFSSQMETIGAKLSLIGVIITVSLTVWPILLLSKWIGQKLGSTGINITVRIMGLILASIAVKFIIEGIKSSLSST